MKFYYSIHGDNKDGWSLNLYQWVPDSRYPGKEMLCPYWYKPKNFENFDDLLTELRTHL